MIFLPKQKQRKRIMGLLALLVLGVLLSACGAPKNDQSGTLTPDHAEESPAAPGADEAEGFVGIEVNTPYGAYQIKDEKEIGRVLAMLPASAVVSSTEEEWAGFTPDPGTWRYSLTYKDEERMRTKNIYQSFDDVYCLDDDLGQAGKLSPWFTDYVDWLLDFSYRLPIAAADRPSEAIHTVDLTLDGVATEVSAGFARRDESGGVYLKASELGALLGVKTEFQPGSDLEGVSATLRTSYEGVTAQLSADSVLILLQADADGRREEHQVSESLLLADGDCYVGPTTRRELFFAAATWETGGNTGRNGLKLDLTSLPVYLQQVREAAASIDALYEPSGDLLIDAYTLNNFAIVSYAGGDCVMIIKDEPRLLMEPVIDHLSEIPQGYVRTMSSQSGNLYYGFYKQPYGNETLPLEFSGIKSLDTRLMFLSLTQGLGADKRYGAAYVPSVNYLDMIPCTSARPLTLEDVIDKLTKMHAQTP